jgi:hypothetical protein
MNIDFIQGLPDGSLGSGLRLGLSDKELLLRRETKRRRGLHLPLHA